MKWSLPSILAAILVILEVQVFTLFVENESMKSRIRSPIILICIVISEVFVYFISIDISFSRPLPVVLEMLFEVNEQWGGKNVYPYFCFVHI